MVYLHLWSMGLELATTTDLLQMEKRIMQALSKIGVSSIEEEEQVLTLTQLRKLYSISHGSLTTLIKSNDITPITHSDSPVAKRYFKEGEIKKYFPPLTISDQ
jgi:hypothetical protein